MRFLALFLRAPLQSWGASAKFGERPSLSFPTKSGILGMLAAASGVDRTDDGWLLNANKLRMTCLIFIPGRRMRDYQTVGGGRDPKNPWTRRLMSSKADGGTPSTVLTNREYLQDATFGVILASEDCTFAKTLADAIQNPVWGVWLGRKSCIPAEPIFAGLAESFEEATSLLNARAKALPRHQGQPASCMTINEVPANQAEEVWHDIPISFATRQFAARPVRQENSDARI